MRNAMRAGVVLLFATSLAMPVLSDTTATGKTLSAAQLRGQKAYLEHCAMCHGDQGAGNGTMAAEIKEKYGIQVPHLEDRARLAAIGGRRKIEQIIREGGAHTGRSMLMPAWGERLGRALVHDLSEYVLLIPDMTRGVPAATIRAYLQAPAGSSEEGRRLFVHHCASCHGSEGKGDGAFAQTLQAHQRITPRNLTDSKYFADKTDAEIFTAISLGGGHIRKAPFMPRWSGYLSPEQIKHLVSYIRAISGTPSRP